MAKKSSLVMKFKNNFSEILLVLIVSVGIILRTPLLNNLPVGRDEFARLLPEFTFTSLIPPGFLLLTKTSAYFANYADWGYRLPIFVFGILGIVLIYYLGKTFFGKIEGLLASLILTGLFIHISLSNQTFEYVPLMSFAALSTTLVYQILFGERDKKLYISAYLLVSFMAIFFSSYFYFLVIIYQVIILSALNFLKNYSQAKKLLNYLRQSQKRLFLALGSVTFLLLLFLIIWRAFDAYFGIRLTFPKPAALFRYFQNIAYFATMDVKYSRFTQTFFLLGAILFWFFPRYRKGYFYLIAFGALDILLVNTARFANAAYPFHYPRYHSFLLPLYVVAVAASVGVLIQFAGRIAAWVFERFKIGKEPLTAPMIKNSIAILILILFVGYNLKYQLPLIKWYYSLPETVLLTNFKDAGRYLNRHLAKGDTLVRVKNFCVATKFNQVNHYLNRQVLAKINYSIFPERTSKNNWYVPLKNGDEDPWGFSDWLVVEKIRPSLRFDGPYIWKLGYFGPLVAVRELEDKSGWKASSNITGEDLNLAFDGDDQTVWGGRIKTGDYFLLDLREAHILNSINYNFSSLFPQNFILKTSLDRVSWQSVFTLAAPGFHPHNFSKVYFKPTKARFIKIEFIPDHFALNRRIEIREIEAFEVYEREVGINRESVFNAEPIKRFNFSENLEGWAGSERVTDLRAEKGELRGQISGKNARISVSVPELSKGKSRVNYLNFALRVDQGKYVSIGLRTKEKTLLLDKIELEPDNLLHYYAFDLNDPRVPQGLPEKIEEIIFTPSDAVGANFGLDFFSLDRRNLPGIQVRDSQSPNGFSQLIPYDPEVDYIFFQFGNKLSLEKGEYLVRFKVKVDAINPSWKEKLPSPPPWRLYSYIEPKEVSNSDILYAFVETTRAIFFEPPARLIIRGQTFQEKDKYYEFSMRFKANGKETIFFQAFSPRHRRYPANLYITYPEVEKIK